MEPGRLPGKSRKSDGVARSPPAREKFISRRAEGTWSARQWLVVGDQVARVARAVVAAAPDVNVVERLVGVADIEDVGIGVEDLVSNVVDDQVLSNRQVVDVVLHGR